MPTITQNLSIPAGLAAGQTASASQITTLYNTMNAFVIPDTVGVLQQALVDDALYTVATGATQTWSIGTVTKTKCVLFLVFFSWAGAAAAPTFRLQVNGSNVTAATALTNAGTGNGYLRVWLGPRDGADVLRGLEMDIVDDGGTSTRTIANADLPNADTTSVGITIGGAGNTTKFKHIRFWREG